MILVHHNFCFFLFNLPILSRGFLGKRRSFSQRRLKQGSRADVTMSWQSYVDDHLIGTGHVTQGAICGVDGSLWAASAGFDVRALPGLTRTWMCFVFIR